MRTITLKFHTARDLVEFIEITETACCDLDKHELIVTCNLTDAEVELAREAYKATVVGDSSLN